MQLGRDWIATHLPHRDAMCLLDGVLAWDERHVVCRAISHREALNPLRVAQQLPAACGIEYGAQAMAVHGALLTRGRLRPGMLASVRSVRLLVARLDDVPGELRVTAERLSGEDDYILYRFSVACDAGELLGGRATVVLDAGLA